MIASGGKVILARLCIFLIQLWCKHDRIVAALLDGGDAHRAEAQAQLAMLAPLMMLAWLALDVKVILTPPCIFY